MVVAAIDAPENAPVFMYAVHKQKEKLAALGVRPSAGLSRTEMLAHNKLLALLGTFGIMSALSGFTFKEFDTCRRKATEAAEDMLEESLQGQGAGVSTSTSASASASSSNQSASQSGGAAVADAFPVDGSAGVISVV